MTDSNVLMKWTLNHKQRGHHCPQCLELAGQIKTMLEWSMTVKPGFHDGCGCSLEVCAGANERDNAPPNSPPKHKGQSGEGPGHGSRGGSVTRPDDPPPNQDNRHTNQPKAPEPDPVIPTPPPATPPDVIYVPKGKPVAT